MELLLSCIVLTYNTRDLLAECLGCFYADALRRGWQVIVVDNASQDGSAALVAERFPAAELLRSERNLGYAGGNNLGLTHARGRYVALVNSDVLISAEVLQGLVETLESQADIGALSPGLLTAEGAPQAFAYGDEPSPRYLWRRLARRALGQGPLHRWDVSQPLDVDWVSGACLCVRCQALQQIGLMDERFFLYFEDTDWCMRMRRAGWRVVYDPRWCVTHLGGASQAKRRFSPSSYYASLRYLYAKHYRGAAAAAVRLMLSLMIRLSSLLSRSK